MKVYKIVPPAALRSLVLVCLLQLGCGKSLQVNPGRHEAQQNRASREEEYREQCIINLMCIDCAKMMWAINENKRDGDDIVKSVVDSYIKGGGAKCPAGGTYTYGNIGEDPRCSVPGHILPGPT